MKNVYLYLIAAVLMLSACGRASALPVPSRSDEQPSRAPAQTNTPFQSVTSTPTLGPTPTGTLDPTQTSTPVRPTKAPTLTPTMVFPEEGRGPENFEAGINPLTGLPPADPSLLERRPIIVKVENLPRIHRPQWGLSLADVVYEYYTEQGTSRFAAIFYGQDAEMVAPIRSGRFFDINVIQMYKAWFVFGSAYVDVLEKFLESDFAPRLLLETLESCPAICRYEPGGSDLLMANTAALQDYVKLRSPGNARQNLDGMFFKAQAPEGGDKASQVYVRFSGAIYNRWDYDPATKRYLRFSDVENDLARNNEVYAQLTDRLTDKPIAADTLVMLCAPHNLFKRGDGVEVLTVPMEPGSDRWYACDGNTYPGGTGPAWVARDGKIYPVLWQRDSITSIFRLVNPDGSDFPYRPGQTWYEVLSQTTTIEQQEDSWRFTFGISW